MIGDLQRLVARITAGEAVIAGVLSGTSADGIDVVLARFPPRAIGEPLGRPRSLAFTTRAFDASLARRLRRVLDGEPTGLPETARLHRDLGLAFGVAARDFAHEAGFELDLVASHGQTVYHHDGDPVGGKATLQLGDGDFVARTAGAPTVSDFRTADVAAGGEGAPLTALVDPLLFDRLGAPAAVLNLGGIANLTVLRSDTPLPLAFDAGPAGALLDGLARELLGRPFDDGGREARAGRIRPELVEATLEHPFFRRPPPKTTGRDTFGAEFVRAFLARGGELQARGEGRPAELLASAVEVVARAVGDACSGLSGAPSPGALRLVVAGGGARNDFLLERLAAQGFSSVESSALHGVDPGAREALAFAVLGARAVLGELSGAWPATGAIQAAILGKFSPGPCRPPSTGASPGRAAAPARATPPRPV